MNIVYLSLSSVPSCSANSVHVMKMCNAFAENGHRVRLLVRKNSDKFSNGLNIFSYYNVKSQFAIQYIPWVNIYGKNYIYSLFSLLACVLQRPDIVYGRNLIGCYFTALCGIPTILEVHAPIQNDFLLFFFKKLILNRHLKKIVVITNALKMYYIKQFPLLESIMVVSPDAADPIDDSLLQDQELSGSNRLQIGYVGHLYKGKGMEVISSLANHCPWADFHVVGGVDPDLSYWKNKFYCNGNIKFYGHVSHAQSVQYLRFFDVLLLPNQNYVSVHGGVGQDVGPWTSPLKAFEYMSAKKPIICSDLPVLREIFVHNYNAMMCQCDNVAQWSEALLLLRDDYGLRQRISKQAYVDFCKKYTWSIRARNVLS